MKKIRQDLGLEPLGFPKCFYAKPEKNIIVMENLKKDGFAMLKMEGKIFKFNKLTFRLKLLHYFKIFLKKIF